MAAATNTPQKSHDFLLRRLHSLTGIIPIGAFLVMHLTVNVMIVFSRPGEDHFQEKVNLIHSLGPLLLPLEIVFIFLPIAFHAGLGLRIWFQGKSNTSEYRYLANYRYMLQRVTGGIVLVFILVHLYHMHWTGKPLGGGQFDPHEASASAAHAMQTAPVWMRAVYAVGIVSACYHFANGIWTFLITWGVTVGRNAQLKSGYVCAAIGVILSATGLAAMNGFMRYKETQVPAMERPNVANTGPGAIGG